MKIRYIIILLLLPIFCVAQTIIPQPVSIINSDVAFDLKEAAQIGYNDKSLVWMAKYLENQIYLISKVKIKHINGVHPSFYLRLKKYSHNGEPKGSYKLSANGGGVFIESENAEGIFYGIQSLLQLINTDTKTILDVEVTMPRVINGAVLCWMSRGIFLEKRR
ncbi:hypothetical protein IDJ75_05940 [Mucilaginibacter rigui]|uniref:Beta-hexosaminidase bacterial type N-terminal domain-containing protein n=1 Tax=Mucilaginibacter rigui TaxID=534635 RepID=A0ABR7X2Q4_9SPHI|nr:glycoside hydrolase family 20 zincin-like fold domain-containing protein [Mucilaginibacter rigui]MBD1384811.1 hypothetical protein [Mucilaginibacter rigui]